MCTKIKSDTKTRTTFGYKVVRITSTTVSGLYYDFKWEKGTNIALGETDSSNISLSHFYVKGGYFHAFTNKRMAVAYLRKKQKDSSNLARGIIKVKMIDAYRGVSNRLTFDKRFEDQPALAAKKAIWNGEITLYY